MNSVVDTVAKLRFAPSPTGYLHVGNARIALLNALLAQQLGGHFLLRIDDTDTERSSETYTTAIREDLQWLGINWQSEERQSLRLDHYQAALQKLIDGGRAYPCYDTAEELSLMRKTALGAGRPPIYDRGALRLSAADRQSLEDQGRRPHWRFKLDHDSTIAWHDLARGHVQFDPANLSDPVLFREDGRALYTITSVVDDGAMQISHILRGEDHVSNTATQIQLFEALGHSVPEFAHLPLLVGGDGKPLSKRHAAASVRGLRDTLGLEATAVSAFLVALGSSTAAEPIAALADLLPGFNLSQYGKASPRFDDDALFALNARVLHEAPLDMMQTRLTAMGLPLDQQQAFWPIVAGNIRVLDESRLWWDIFTKARNFPELDVKDWAFCRQAAELLSDEALSKEGYQRWIQQVKLQSGRKGKALFMPIRRALTGLEHGPELDQILPFIGMDVARARLQGDV